MDNLKHGRFAGPSDWEGRKRLTVVRKRRQENKGLWDFIRGTRYPV